ncbi:hypothetical protein HYFRA_00002453 [Hymenoscyphus fraxineus]|uniref:RRM domain-containing protein n=1 Tax=Hymenoscyphus fraxineus TaxID=746836 RepID=A0A9N9LAZ3_9HELO|nr:hypothetical protein HYFRA_00002453 [Hymenoscyphus fraxineus]
MQDNTISLHSRECQNTLTSPCTHQDEHIKKETVSSHLKSKPIILVLLKEWLEENKVPLPEYNRPRSYDTPARMGKLSQMESYLSTFTFERMDRECAQRNPSGTIDLSVLGLHSRTSSIPMNSETKGNDNIGARTGQHSSNGWSSPTNPVKSFPAPNGIEVRQGRQAVARSGIVPFADPFEYTKSQNGEAQRHGFPPLFPSSGAPLGSRGFSYKLLNDGRRPNGTGFGYPPRSVRSADHPETKLTLRGSVPPRQPSQKSATPPTAPHQLDQCAPLRPSDMIWREHGLMAPKEHPIGENHDIPDEENCSLWITKVPATVTERDFFELITCGAVHTLHLYPPTSDIDTKGAKLIFKEPSSAAKFMQDHAQNPVHLHGHGITIEYNRNGVRRCGEEKTRVLRIQGPRNEMLTEAFWNDFFHSFCRCKFDFAYPPSNIPGEAIMDIRFSRIVGQSQMAMLGFHRGHARYPKLRVSYGPDPCDGTQILAL